MANKFQKITILIAILYFSAIQEVKSNILWCYDCGPDDGDLCKNPEKSGIKASVCEVNEQQQFGLKRQLGKIEKDIIEPRGQNLNLTFECVSIYFISYEDQKNSGIYRGCYERTNEIASTCDLINEEVDKGNLTYCRACSDNSCNLHEINNPSGSVAVFAANNLNSFILIAILSFLVLKFD